MKEMLKDICQEYGVNEEQAQALDIDKNIALRAGAGSGKTRVLTCRYLRLLTERPEIDLDSIVAITFTRKAATKMKEEIRKRIALRIEQATTIEEREKWKTVRALIATANINTIHGFCGNLLRDNFAVLGIDPNFRVMEEVDGATKLNEFMEEALAEYLENLDTQEVVNLVLATYSSSIITSGALREATISLYHSLREKGVDLLELEKVMLVKNPPENPGVANLEKIALELVKKLDAKYQNFKARESLLDYSDLEIMAQRLLDNEEIRLAYFQRYQYFLVDEFQDVNPLQKRILDKLVVQDQVIPPGRLFIVGDHKQSIYGFRGSDYQIFEETCQMIEKNGEVKMLANCYRSTWSIVDTVNAVFEQLLDPFERLNIPEGKNEQGPRVELITWPKDVVEDPNKKHWEVVKKLLVDDDKGEELKKALHNFNFNGKSVSKLDYQGEVLAGKILELSKEGFAFKDLAILLRSRSSLKTIENSLLKQQIPYCVLGGIGFWGRQEIMDIIALYRLVFNTEDLVAFLTVLRSPIFGFSDDLIFSLMQYKQEGILQALEKLEDHQEAWLVQRALKILEKCFRSNGVLNAYQLLKKLCQETAYPEILLALPEGQRKFRNLEKLLAIVREFERKGIYTAGELPAYLEMLEENSGLDAESFLDTEASDAVKILTIHASKGLEFGGVIIPDLGRALDGISKRNKPLFYYGGEQGIVAIGLNEKGEKDKDANPAYGEVYQQQLLRENSDSRRIFYVAATRAEKYLGLLGEDQELKEESETDPLILNSFLKQLKWALKKAGEMPWLECLDGSNQGTRRQVKAQYSTEFIQQALTGLNSLSSKELDPWLKKIQAPPKGNINISMYLKYLDCPRLYYFSNLARLQSNHVCNKETSMLEDNVSEEKGKEPMDAALRGTIIHRLLENIHNLKWDRRNFNESLLAEVKRGLAEEFGESFNPLKGEIKKYLESYSKAEASFVQGKKGQLIKTFHEYTFRVPIEAGLTLNGAIDRVDIYEHQGKLEAYVIDYKTNKISGEGDLLSKADYYRKQLYAYSYVLSQLPIINGVKPQVKGTYLYFLDCGQCVEVKVTDNEVEELRKELRAASPWLLGSKSFTQYPFTEGKNCVWCQYQDYCKTYSLQAG